MIEQIFEDAYNHYDGKLKLSKLHEYLSKLDSNSDKKYLKCLDLKSNGMAIYNVVDILVSKSIADGTAALTDDDKYVRIVLSGDQNSKTYSFKLFVENSKKILNLLKDVDQDQVKLQVLIAGSDKGMPFRFYYDDEKDFAILVRGTDAKGAIKFLETFEEDLLTYINVPVSTKVPKVAKEKLPKQIKLDLPKTKKHVDRHEGYVRIDKTDSFGHRITLWKKDPDYVPDNN